MESIVQQILALVPDNCPACGAPTRFTDDAEGNKYAHLQCTNQLCPAKSARRFEIAAKTLDVKFFGPSVCEALVEYWPTFSLFLTQAFSGEGSSTEEKLIKAGITPGVAARLYSEVLKLKESGVEAWRCLAAAQPIRVGETTSKKLLEHFADDLTLVFDSCVDGYRGVQTAIGRTGDTLAEEIRKGLLEVRSEVETLRSFFPQVQQAPVVENGALSGHAICVTGSIPGFSRQGIKEFVESHGAKFVSGVSKNTTILLTEDTQSGTSKNEKAKKFGTQVINFQQLKRLVGDSTPVQPFEDRMKDPEEFNLSAGDEL